MGSGEEKTRRLKADNLSTKPEPLQEGVDYYLENDLVVFTSIFLKKRGYCCESGCRHCPYGFANEISDRSRK